MTDSLYSAKHWANKSQEYAEQSHADQIQSDFGQSDNTKVDFIKNKPTKLSDFTDDSATTPIARATGDGSGNEITQTYATKDLDNLSIAGRNKLAVSLIYALTGTGTKLLQNNYTYRLTTSGDVTISLPTGSISEISQIMLYLKKANASHNIDLGTTYYFNEEAPDLSDAGDYNIVYEYDPNESHWVVGAVKKGAAS